MAITSLIFPSSAWLSDPGLTWTGRTAPTESGLARGAGFNQKAIALPDVPRRFWLEAGDGDFEVTVAADHADSAWIEEVEFWLEGSTVTVTETSLSARTGVEGFSCVIDASATTSDGDAELYATIRPVNGYERLIGPITIHLNYNGTISRAARYVDWSSGDDSYDGTSATYISGTTGPWKTINKAQTTAPDGAVVNVAAGTYLEDSNSGGISANDRVLTIRAADGLALGDVIVDRTSRDSPASYLQIRRRYAEFIGIAFDHARIDMIWGAYPTGVYNFVGCSFIDGNGLQGPQTSYYAPTQAGQYLFRPNEGQWNFLQDCSIANYVAAGAHIYLNTTAEVSADSLFYDTGQAGLEYNGAFGFTVSQPSEFPQRIHPETSLTVSSAVYSDPNTVITFSDTPDLAKTAETLKFLTGTLAGQEFTAVSQDNGADTITVSGDASAAVSGDTAWAWLIFHADSMQFAAGNDYENLLFQRYKATGITSQPWLFQPWTGNYVKDLAMQNCIFDQYGGGNEISQWRDEHVHIVIRNVTHTGTETTFRADSGGFALTDCLIVDSVWNTMDSTGTFPSSGITIDNNWFEAGLERGTNSDGGSVNYDSEYYPSGITKISTGSVLGYDYYNRARQGSSIVGAVALQSAPAPRTYPSNSAAYLL